MFESPAGIPWRMFELWISQPKNHAIAWFFVDRKRARLAHFILAFIDDVRAWVMENRLEARTLSNSIRELAKQAALREKKAA